MLDSLAYDTCIKNAYKYFLNVIKCILYNYISGFFIRSATRISYIKNLYYSKLD